MTKTTLRSLREQLLSLDKRLGADVSHLEDEAFPEVGRATAGNLSKVPLHPADVATDHSEQEKTMGLLEREQQTLHEITAALVRIEQGIFGRCEECAEEIPEARLEAVPYARHCIDCARKIEAEAGYGAVTRS
jgi:RNA polymerase-binding protein DksA